MPRILVAGIDEIDYLKFNTPDKVVDGKLDVSFMNKPNGCLWGSTMLHNDYYLSDWLRWVLNEGFYPEKYCKGISFTLKKKARICTIDTVEDYRNVARKYSTAKYDKEQLQSRFRKRIIDWKKLSRDYDAFHLTEGAFWKMRLPFDESILKDENGNYLENFYSYDCESWILFNLDCINRGSILNHSISMKY